MNMPTFFKRRTAEPKAQARGNNRVISMIESLEDRRLMSAVAPLVVAKNVAPGKILAGSKLATETVKIHNPNKAVETVAVTIHLDPSLDGVTAAGSYGIADYSSTLTLKKLGNANVKIQFTPPTTLAAGKYHTIATVQLDGVSYTAVTPGTYNLVLPPAPTTTPSLIGHYSGLIVGTVTQDVGLFGSTTSTKAATFIWQTTSQDLGSLSGIFAVGSQQVTGTMVGSENTTGAITFTLTSDLINYTIKGKVTPDGSKITGTFKGTLVNNIFKTLSGNFKILRQTT